MNRFARALQTPWKIRHELLRIFGYPYMRLAFLVNGVAWGRGWRVYGTPHLMRHMGSTIRIGDRLHLRSWPTSNPLGVVRRSTFCTWTREAVIEIADELNATGIVVCCSERVTIGARARIGANTTIIDTDFHPLEAAERLQDPRAGQTAPVRIGNDVFIGMWSMILKGVTIGDGALIGAGSVVSRDVPPGARVAGNPARIVRAGHAEDSALSDLAQTQ